MILSGAALWVAPFAWADQDVVPSIAHDIYVLGEVHDNPAHHDVQTAFISRVQPRAVVFEMLTAREAEQLAEVPRDALAMTQATEGFHWGNIADYASVLAASNVIVGAALSREAVREAFSKGAAEVFGPGAEGFGLTRALPEDEMALRKDMQFAAHCDAMPREMMGGMIEAQRLRDAAFARAVVDAVTTHGTPVILITGNGHARTDWGVPVYLQAARPDLSVFSLGQSEDGTLAGAFHSVANAPAVDRTDPCAAFQ